MFFFVINVYFIVLKSDSNVFQGGRHVDRGFYPRPLPSGDFRKVMTR